MTTFQDPPYQSRRAVRQSGHVDDVEVDAPVRPATARTGRRAQLPSATEWNGEDGTGASGGTGTPAPPATLTLATPLQPQIPVYDAPASETDTTEAIGGSGAGTHRAPASTATTSGASVAASTTQGRRASLATGQMHSGIAAAALDSAPSVAAATPVAVEPAPAEAPASPANVEPPTVVEPATIVEPAPVVAEPAPAPAVVAPQPDRPLTRRELREARVAAERAAGMAEVPEAIVSILNSGPIILPYLSSPATTPLSPGAAAVANEDDAVGHPRSARVETALAEFDELTREHEGDAVPIGAEEHPAAPVSTWGMPLEPSSANDGIANDVAANDVTPAVDVDDEDDDVIDASDKVAPVEPELQAESVSESQPELDSEPIVVPMFIEPGQTPVSNRGAGHWSVNSDTDDDIESLENTVTRSVGAGGALTTSALVLPSFPQSSDLTTPYLATGETMLTGSIDLPRSLGSTGVHPSQVDNSDFDVDPLDREVPTTDSAPVRAIRAVSTHTGSNGLITSKKPQGNHMLTVLVVSSSGLAVVVVGLLIAGVSSGLFQ
ncbi:hypothetical protein B0I08_101274 [Glaciihabitans tibetensis]|uniref:Uncharacterized protein n=1 Tax=Glaciihabitans tibetensis TaxID=1266600 RepID=A0A2T0VIV3_9MICO|nr:hypothetical protein [Glaciihabitans tibetensis]PRY70147.1 hypothetical protein B0I08_101274 [Glaciihabitans tibetensis]